MAPLGCHSPEVTNTEKASIVTSLVVLNTSPQKSLWKGHLAALSLPGSDGMPLFVQAEASMGLPTRMTSKPSPMKHQQELHTQESQTRYLILYEARNKFPRLKKGNPSSEEVAPLLLSWFNESVECSMLIPACSKLLTSPSCSSPRQREYQPKVLDSNQKTRKTFTN